ncbi:NADH-quinone oxidoreductase subunit F [Bacteroides reticulotermitis]|uniref:NADH-quinone oxidoreductase subunit F n=1 Tax=Bacteroides reticulotermitis TaxID=1133319 RepID=UPI003A88AA1C
MNKQDALFINDINGEVIEVTNLEKAIEQCEMCIDSVFVSVRENHKYMLRQLLRIKEQQKTEPKGSDS